MKEPFSVTSLTALAFYDQDTYCWRMSQGTLLSEESELLPNLPDWGTTAVGVLYELPMPERLTYERDSLSGEYLKTPLAADPVKPRPQKVKIPRGPHDRYDFPDQLAHLLQQTTEKYLPTPLAWDHKNHGPNIDWKKRQNHVSSVNTVLMNLLYVDWQVSGVTPHPPSTIEE